MFKILFRMSKYVILSVTLSVTGQQIIIILDRSFILGILDGIFISGDMPILLLHIKYNIQCSNKSLSGSKIE